MKHWNVWAIIQLNLRGTMDYCYYYYNNNYYYYYYMQFLKQAIYEALIIFLT